MDVRPGVIKNYAQRHVISDNYCFAVYGISIIDQNGDIITNYAQRADDIKYFDSVTDFQNYVNKLKQKLHAPFEASFHVWRLAFFYIYFTCK